MRRLLAVTVFILGLVSTQAVAQGTRPVRIAGHFTGTMFDGPFDNILAGGRVLFPLGSRVDLYPSVSRLVDGFGAAWQVSIALQYRPFGSASRTPFYFSAGWTGINDGRTGDGFDLLAVGVEIPSRRLRPFAELQFLGSLRHVANPQAGFGVQTQFGMTWAIR
jgi:hypothetical protein